MRILIADDHAIVRRGARELLEDEFPGSQFVEAQTGEQAVASLTGVFDLVIIDVSMPGRGGVDAVKEIRERAPRVPIIVLSQHAEAQYVVRALRAGARGYVTKDSATDELVRAVHSVLQGRKYVTAAIAEQLLDGMTSNPEGAQHEALSDRELQVLRMLGSGLSIKEIAHQLALSDKTASTYRRRILDKLELKSTADLIRYALKEKLSE